MANPEKGRKDIDFRKDLLFIILHVGEEGNRTIF
jgi:hypothetical protein